MHATVIPPEDGFSARPASEEIEQPPRVRVVKDSNPPGGFDLEAAVASVPDSKLAKTATGRWPFVYFKYFGGISGSNGSTEYHLDQVPWLAEGLRNDPTLRAYFNGSLGDDPTDLNLVERITDPHQQFPYSFTAETLVPDMVEHTQDPFILRRIVEDSFEFVEDMYAEARFAGSPEIVFGLTGAFSEEGNNMFRMFEVDNAVEGNWGGSVQAEDYSVLHNIWDEQLGHTLVAMAPRAIRGYADERFGARYVTTHTQLDINHTITQLREFLGVDVHFKVEGSRGYLVNSSGENILGEGVALGEYVRLGERQEILSPQESAGKSVEELENMLKPEEGKHYERVEGLDPSLPGVAFLCTNDYELDLETASGTDHRILQTGQFYEVGRNDEMGEGRQVGFTHFYFQRRGGVYKALTWIANKLTGNQQQEAQRVMRAHLRQQEEASTARSRQFHQALKDKYEAKLAAANERAGRLEAQRDAADQRARRLQTDKTLAQERLSAAESATQAAGLTAVALHGLFGGLGAVRTQLAGDLLANMARYDGIELPEKAGEGYDLRQLLEGGELSERARADIETLLTGFEGLDGVVGEMRTHLRALREGADKVEEMDYLPLVEAAIKNVETRYPGFKITCLANESARPVLANHFLGEVYKNLLTNAAHATLEANERDGTPLELVVRCVPYKERKELASGQVHVDERERVLIYQKPEIPGHILDKLKLGKAESTKGKGGSGIGASESFNLVTGTFKGNLTYSSPVRLAGYEAATVIDIPTGINYTK